VCFLLRKILSICPSKHVIGYIYIYILVYIQADRRIRGLPRPEKIWKIKEINGSCVSKRAPSENRP